MSGIWLYGKFKMNLVLMGYDDFEYANNRDNK